jgi:acetyl esterase/lipase
VTLPRRTLPVLTASALGAVLLSACGGDGPSDSPPATETTVSNGLTVVTGVPRDEVADGFVERIVYPVRGGAPDPAQNWADLYLPPGDRRAGALPLVVYLQGSAWNGGAHGARRVSSDLASRGLAVLNVEYRGADEGGGWPTTFTDGADALDHVPTIAGHRPGISVDDATVVGHSAGGQLAAWAGFRGQLDQDRVGANPRFSPARVVSLAGPLDLVRAAENGDDNIVEAMGGTPSELPGAYDGIDPIRNIDRDLAVVAVHGTGDSLVPPGNSERYVEAARKAGADAELVLFRGAGHKSFLSSSSSHYGRLLSIIHRTATVPRQELDGGLFR